MTRQLKRMVVLCAFAACADDAAPTASNDDLQVRTYDSDHDPYASLAPSATSDSEPTQDDLRVDLDGDGFFAPEDCDDTRPNVFPGQPELCDGINNGCLPNWSDANEAGIVTHISADDNSATDLTPNFVGTTAGTPPDPLTLMPGTTQICGGTYLVDLFADTTDVSLVGFPDAASVVLSPSNAVGLTVAAGAVVDAQRLTFRGSHQVHTGIVVASGATASLSDVHIDTFQGLTGGGIWSSGALTITSATLTENDAVSGGAIFVDDGTTTVVDSSLSANTATQGGAIHVANGTITLNNTLLLANQADWGGGAYVGGGGTLDCIATPGQLAGVHANIGNMRGGGLYLDIDAAGVTSDVCDFGDADNDQNLPEDVWYATSPPNSYEFSDDALFACAEGTCSR